MKLVEMQQPFIDERGSIQNLVSLKTSCLELVSNVALIRSKRGAIRSNHYHKDDWHFLYMISGRMLYFERAAGAYGCPAGNLVLTGQMVYTPARVEHAVLFLAESELLSMSRGPQTRDEHEADVVRVELLSREYADALLKEFP